MNKFPRTFALFVCAFAGIEFYFALQQRALEDIFKYLPWIAFVFLVALSALFIERERRPTALTTSLKIWSVLPMMFLVPIVASIITYSSIVLAYDFLSAAIQTKSAIRIAILATIAGLVLWFFRFKCRSTYGLIEALVGVYLAWRTVEANTWKSESDMYLAVLTAGVYLIVRGVDNIEQGLEKDRLIAYLKSLKQRTFNKHEDKIAVEKFDRSNRAQGDKINREDIVQSIASPAERYIDKDSLSPENLSRFPQLVERIREIELKRKINL